MTWKPNKWIALLLGLLVAPIGMLYVGAPRLALIAFGVPLLVGILGLLRVGGDTGLVILGIIQILLVLLFMIVAYRIARNAVVVPDRHWSTRWYGLLGVCAIGVGIVGCVRIFAYEPYVAPSTSMAPTANAGANLVVQKWGYGHFSTFGMVFGSRQASAKLERGDIVAFDYPYDPKQTYVKRIVGLPGDRIVYRDNHLFVNNVDARGRQLDDYSDDATSPYSIRFQEKLGNKEYEVLLRKKAPHFPVPRNFAWRDMCVFNSEEIRCTVPAGNYFVLGDNRDNSADSRMWGFVRADLVLGKVVHIAQ